MEPTNHHLELWDLVEKTDPAYTKDFSATGGFSGTAINSAYQVKKATEKFGPFGIGWGYTIEDEKYVPGFPLGYDADGRLVGTTIVHVIRLKLWYEWKGKRGEVYHFGQTTFVGRNRNGVFHDEEAPKKSVTDAMSKCLSLLGFSADVHLGHYDDNKYVAALRQEFGGGDGKPAANDAKGAAKGPSKSNPSVTAAAGTVKAQDVNAWLKRIGVLGKDALDSARDTAKSYFKDAELKRVHEAIDARLASLGGGVKQPNAA